jgi:hypothetical protein
VEPPLGVDRRRRGLGVVQVACTSHQSDMSLASHDRHEATSQRQ